jgi:hypothetical protein
VKEERIDLTPPYGEVVMKLDVLGQIARIGHLATVFPIEVPHGNFANYFGVAVAVLARLWIGEPMDTFPHFLCPGIGTLSATMWPASNHFNY